LCKAGGAVVINIETTVGPSNRRNGIFRLTADIQVQPLQAWEIAVRALLAIQHQSIV
jgi:hypothetical protein